MSEKNSNYKQKSILVGGAFSNTQYLWVLILMFKYCNINNIKNIIFENEISEDIINSKYLKKEFKKFNIILKKKNYFLLILEFIIYYSFNFILDIKNDKNFKKQFNYSFSDTCRLKNNKNFYNISYVTKIKSILILFSQYTFINKLLKNYYIKDVFYGHSVYQYRLTLSLFKSKKVNFFVQANNSLYKTNIHNEVRWDFLDTYKYKILSKIISKKKVLNYWNQRNRGFSQYEDFNVSSKITNEAYFDKKLNIIMLHIFQDSPFNYIDSKKIFFDYFHWLHHTISILNKSKEDWFLKFHPNAHRWGEDSRKIFFDFIKKDKISLGKNIKFLENTSNLSIFNNLSKLITFSGTSGLEAISYGVKPICISRITHHSSVLNKQYFLPRSLKVYKDLILKKPDHFKVSNEKDRYEAKKIIYLRENALTLNPNFTSRNIYRGDSINYKIKQFNKMKDDIDNNYKYLNTLGEIIAKKQIFLSKEFGEKILKN